MYAEWEGNEKIEATPDSGHAICPVCKAEVIPRCGEINIWHWAHKNKEECDSWSEGETEWHKEWKERFPKECREVTIGNHRADIFLTDEKLVIELQHSPITPKEIIDREKFYKNMIWIFDNNVFKEIEKQSSSFIVNNKGTYQTFRWKHAKRSIMYARKPILIDYFDTSSSNESNVKNPDDFLVKRNIFLIKKIYYDNEIGRCGGWGYRLDDTVFGYILHKGVNSNKLTDYEIMKEIKGD